MKGHLRGTMTSASNVVALHTSQEATDDIVASVLDRSRRRQEETSAALDELVAQVDLRHRQHAQQCVSLGYAMDRPTLDAWIEIGRRMLGKGKRA